MSPDREQSFDEFVAARYGALRRTAYLLCGDWHLAEDLVQSALIRVYARWHKLNDSQAAHGYARTTLVRTYIDNRRRRAGSELATSGIPDIPALGPDTDQKMTLLAALSQVTPAYRAALVLRYWEDLSVEQTAAALNKSSSAVRSNTHRGLTQLRSIIGDALNEIAAN